MRFLAIDPGETTGWALFDDFEVVDAGQEELVLFIDEVAEGLGVGRLGDPTIYAGYGPFAGVERLVIERFALYPWVIKEGGLDFDEVRTAQGIGALKFIARHANIPVTMQPATIKEPAQAGGARELFYRPLHENRHQNDAIMHGWYYAATRLGGQTIELPKYAASMQLVDPEALTAPEGND